MSYKEEDGDIYRDPIEDKDDLYYRAALLMNEIETWHEDNPSFRGDENSSYLMTLNPVEAEQQIPVELVELHRQLEEFLEIVAAHPKFRHLVVSWVVIIDGYDGIDDDKMNIKEEDLNEETIFGSIGGIYQAVQAYLDKEGYLIIKKVAGHEGWSLELVCNDEAARDLCDSLHRKFKKAINRGLLTVKKGFWGYNLLGLSPETYRSFLDKDENAFDNPAFISEEGFEYFKADEPEGVCEEEKEEKSPWSNTYSWEEDDDDEEDDEDEDWEEDEDSWEDDEDDENYEPEDEDDDEENS